ncbi:glycosyl transferase family 2 [Desulfatibacillum aliphaticivorans]|uniref:dolichyl-phosphate beta-glucosyltransferase n=1 Tax=Desulfatibacillum aliphaticivorans TaxID=218208 RepID=B8FFT9_DESAL|nr:dolichyl-phosphate beta-glucosyltransferase [Desulfatibacillum aliphaticivorans]ACL03494.1 glycosyl transferase family 2 [Desulfatibacillum aliphaticivorans]
MVKLSIVIPAYNEEDRIVRTLEKTVDYLSAQDYSSEVVVVSDGSKDNTVAVARGYSKEGGPEIRVLEYFPNRGKGCAVQYGMLRAKGERVLFMDADYAVPIEEIVKPMAVLDKGFDVAIASRAMTGAVVKETQNLPRAISAKVYKIIQRLVLGISHPDTQCGFKMFTQKAARDLFSRQKLHSVIFDPEILWLARQRGYKVGEFPVVWSHVEDSRIVYDSLAKSLFVFQELFRIRKVHGSEKN